MKPLIHFCLLLFLMCSSSASAMNCYDGFDIYFYNNGFGYGRFGGGVQQPLEPANGCGKCAAYHARCLLNGQKPSMEEFKSIFELCETSGSVDKTEILEFVRLCGVENQVSILDSDDLFRLRASRLNDGCVKPCEDGPKVFLCSIEVDASQYLDYKKFTFAHWIALKVYDLGHDGIRVGYYDSLAGLDDAPYIEFFRDVVYQVFGNNHLASRGCFRKWLNKCHFDLSDVCSCFCKSPYFRGYESV